MRAAEPNPSAPPSRLVAQRLTPAGAGAIALIRVAGPGAADVVARFFRPRRGTWPTAQSLDRLVYGNWVKSRVDCAERIRTESRPLELSGAESDVAEPEVVDDVLVCAVRADGTEVEVSCHGGVHVTRRILQALAEAGAHVSEATIADAWPVRGCWDAAVLRGLEAARTPRAVRLVLRQSVRTPEAVRAAMRHWPEDQCRTRSELLSMCDAGRRAQRLIKGATVAIVGPPNAGKSTLLNRLVGRPAAITSPQPGTTRDWIEGEVDVEGVALQLIDLAGFRDTDDPLERRAMAAAASRLRQADLCLVVVDGTSPTAEADLRRISRQTCRALAGDHATSAAPLIEVLNKSDLMRGDNVPTSRLDASTSEPPVSRVIMSAVTGDGVAALLKACLQSLGLDGLEDDVPCVFDADVRDRLARFLGDEAGEAGTRRGAACGLLDRRTAPDRVEALLRELFGLAPSAPRDDERQPAGYNQ